MKIRSLAAAATIGAMIQLAQGAAEAAEVKLIAGVAMSAVMGELGPQFERTTGHKLVIWYGDTGTIRQRLEAGEAFDLFLGGGTGQLIKQGKIAADTRTEIARVGIGVGVRAGAPKPDISSAEAFKRALINAKSIAYLEGGLIGTYLKVLFQRLGIAEQMKAKTKPYRKGLAAVADGEAELGFALTNELLFFFSGVELVGPFPPELQRYLVFIAGVGTAAEQPEAAKALIRFLRSPAAVAVIKAKGLEPATP